MNGTATLATAVTDAYNDHDLARYMELHDPAARISFANIAGDVGLGSWLTTLERLFSALPDLAVRPVKLLADESTAIVELHQVGTNTVAIPLEDGDRELLGTDLASVPPTGRSVDVTGVVVLTTARGRVTAERHHWPRHWFYECLGLLAVATTPTGHWKTKPFVPGIAHRRPTRPDASVSDHPTSASLCGDRRQSPNQQGTNS